MHGLNLHRCRLLSTLALSLAANACAPSRSPGTVVYASGTDLESANPLVTVHPLSRQVQRYALLVTLARYDSALAPQPYAARRWEWSSDHRTLVFHLVSSLRWQDGVPSTARDAAFTIDAARDPATGYPRAADLAGVDSVYARDDSTLVVAFRAPPPSFPLVFCELPIVPEHVLRATPRSAMARAAFNTAPIGNGPFEFAQRVPGQRWVFRRNDHFPAELGGPPAVRQLVIAVVDEPTTKFAGLTSGELDVAGIAPNMASLAARDRSLRVISYPIMLATGLVFNVHRAPFDDIRVRQAISLSIDRDRIVRAALDGFGRPASGPIPPESPFALDTAALRDTARADSLFDAAGWRRGADGFRQQNGRALAFTLTTVGSGDNALEQLVQADLAERGIRVGIRQVELGAFFSLARGPHKGFDVLVAGIPGDVALGYVGAMFDSRQANGALDYSGFHTPRLDDLLVAAYGAATPQLAALAWRDVQRELARDVPVAWIYHARGVQGVSARLGNVTMDLRGEMVSVARWTR